MFMARCLGKKLYVHDQGSFAMAFRMLLTSENDMVVIRVWRSRNLQLLPGLRQQHCSSF